MNLPSWADYIEGEIELSVTTATGSTSNLPATSELAGKVILVTGGASGLGAALCQVMAAAGANIMVGDLNEEKAFRTVDKIRTPETAAHAITFDVGDPASAERALEETIGKSGKLDVLINNAGTDVTLPIDELSFEDWDAMAETSWP